MSIKFLQSRFYFWPWGSQLLLLLLSILLLFLLMLFGGSLRYVFKVVFRGVFIVFDDVLKERSVELKWLETNMVSVFWPGS